MSIAIEATSTDADSGSPQTLNLPTDISAGDVLIGFHATRSTFNQVETWPSGWDLIAQADAFDCGMQIRRKVATGSEGASMSVSFNAGGENTTFLCYRLSGAHQTTLPEISSIFDTGSSTSTGVNPPNLAPSWGTEETLWIACYFLRQNFSPTGWPSNYTLSQINRTNNGGSAMCARLLSASSENPGAFTHTAAQGGAFTLAVRPAPLGLAERRYPRGVLRGVLRGVAG